MDHGLDTRDERSKTVLRGVIVKAQGESQGAGNYRGTMMASRTLTCPSAPEVPRQHWARVCQPYACASNIDSVSSLGSFPKTDLLWNGDVVGAARDLADVHGAGAAGALGVLVG